MFRPPTDVGDGSPPLDVGYYSSSGFASSQAIVASDPGDLFYADEETLPCSASLKLFPMRSRSVMGR